MPLQRYTILVSQPPSQKYELSLEEREEIDDDSDSDSYNQMDELDDDDVELRGNSILDEAAAAAAAAASSLSAGAVQSKASSSTSITASGTSKADTQQTACAKSELTVEHTTTMTLNELHDLISSTPSNTTSAPTKSVQSMASVTSTNNVPRTSNGVNLKRPAAPLPQSAAKRTTIQICNKRKRSASVLISQKSPIFSALKEIRKRPVKIEDLATHHDEWLRFALSNAIKPNDTIQKVEHKIRYSQIATLTSNRPINKLRTSRVGKRRSSPYFRTDLYKTVWLQNKSGGVKELENIISNPLLYPLYLTVQRWVTLPQAARNACNHPPCKRLKTDPSVKVIGAKAAQPKNDVICLVDSSEEEAESPKKAINVACFKQKANLVQLDTKASPIPVLPTELTPCYEPPPDPLPKTFNAADNGDFVLTPYGAGKILSSRVERRASTSGETSIFQPTIIYTIDLDFGVCHVPSSHVKSISGTPFVSKSILTYNKVPITEMDLLRLRPMTYLNDSIVNFYLKYLKAQFDKANPESKIQSNSRGWDDLDGRGVCIFPSFCYNRIVSIMGDDNRNIKANRRKIWKELRTWAKGEDIFKKRMLIFPINYHLHWTALFVFHPGRLIRRHSAVEVNVAPHPQSLGVLSSVKTCLTDMGNHITSSLKAANPSQTTSSESVQTSVSDTAPEQSQTSGVQYRCDYCDLATYDTYAEAEEHEKRCPKNQDWCMLHFDSGKHFKLHEPQKIAGYIKKYLSAYYDAEYAHSHPGVGALTQTNMPGYTSSIPQQDNTKDCGVFMLEIVERILSNPPVVDSEFVKKKCKSFAKDSFGKDVIEKKRGNIMQLVHSIRLGEEVDEDER